MRWSWPTATRRSRGSSTRPSTHHGSPGPGRKHRRPMAPFDRLFHPERDSAVVTGAGNGIGRAIALGLVAQGVRTVFADVKAETVAAAVESAANPKLAFAWTGDLAQKSECDRLLADARARNGLVTRLVHSASPPRHERDHALSV